MIQDKVLRIKVLTDNLETSWGEDNLLRANGFHIEAQSFEISPRSTSCLEETDLIVLRLTSDAAKSVERCREIRRRFSGPILVVSPTDADVPNVAILENGADVHLKAPVEPRLLLAYVNKLVQLYNGGGPNGNAPSSRIDSTIGSTNVIDLGSIAVDRHRRSARIDGREVALTTSEFDLLWLLARNANEVVTRDQLHSELVGFEYDGLNRTMDLRLARLRRKLGDNARSPKLIKSVRSIGYLLVAT